MKILAAILCLIGMVARGEETGSLGLAERRALKEYQEKYSNADDVKDRIDALKKLLESKLWIVNEPN